MGKRFSKEYKEWKDKILSIGKCQLCGSILKLRAHHIISFGSFDGLFDYNIDFGLCLCHKCHSMWHMSDKKLNEDTKNKMSENHYDCSGEKNPMYGKKRPKELSGMYGKKHSDKTKLKMKEMSRWNRWQKEATC